MTGDPYNYDHFRFRHYLGGKARSVEAGEEAIEETVYDLSGGERRLSEVWAERPAVLEFGSITCPVFLQKIQPMDALARRFADRAGFAVLYVREAHPGRRRPAHASLAEKLRRARELVGREGLRRPVLVDSIDGKTNRDYGAMPNSVYVIGTDGVVAYRADWCDPEEVEAALERLLAEGGEGAAVASVSQEDNFASPSPGLLATTLATFRKAGSPALRDFLSQLPRMVPWRLRTWLRVLLLAGPLLFGEAGTTVAQDAPAVAEARRLRQAGELEAAAARLRDHLRSAPDDVDARWLYAQTLYWTGRLEPAREEYLRALGDRPGDTGLRLDVTRFLVETGHPREARRTLAPILEVRDRLPPGAAAEAERLEIAIARATAPWIAARPEARHDDQPLTAYRVEIEAGHPVAPGISLAARATPWRLDSDEGETDLTELELALAVHRPDFPVEVELAGGASVRSEPDVTSAIGRAALAVRLGEGIRLRGEARRWEYLWTVRSLATDVLVESFEAALDRSEAPGWAGKAGARIDRFPDDNEIGSAYAWLLAPVVRRPEGSLRIGYAFEFQDASETRFTPAGVYDPYYTPEEVLAHSVIAAVALVPGTGVTLAFDGAVGASAEEQAPSLEAPTPPTPRPPTPSPPTPSPPTPTPSLSFVERDFTPWRIRGRVEADLSPTLSLRVEGEHRSAAFFEITRGSAGLTFRFAP